MAGTVWPGRRFSAHLATFASQPWLCRHWVAELRHNLDIHRGVETCQELLRVDSRCSAAVQGTCFSGSFKAILGRVDFTALTLSLIPAVPTKLQLLLLLLNKENEKNGNKPGHSRGHTGRAIPFKRLLGSIPRSSPPTKPPGWCNSAFSLATSSLQPANPSFRSDRQTCATAE